MRHIPEKKVQLFESYSRKRVQFFESFLKEGSIIEFFFKKKKEFFRRKGFNSLSDILEKKVQFFESYSIL